MRVLTVAEMSLVAGGDYGDGGGDYSDDIVVTAPSDGGGDYSNVSDGSYDSGDVVVTASSDSSDNATGGSSGSSTGPDIVVTAPRNGDPNYEIDVPNATRFACPVGNVPFFGNYGTPKGTLGAHTHVSLTPAAYNKMARGCVFNSGAGAYHLSAR